MQPSPSSEQRTQARTWVLVMADPDVGAEDQIAFRSWYNASNANASAYERELDLHYAIEPMRARFAQDKSLRGAKFGRVRFITTAGLALAAGIGLALLIPHEPVHQWRPPVATHLAEVRESQLPDGSRITLGPQSQFETAFTANERRVRLSGEAYFSVAHDEARPFIVEAQGTLIRDVGTEFEIKSDADGVRVTVARGAVDVTEPARLANFAGERMHRLVAGQQVSLMPTALSVEAQTAPAPSEPAAWREGFLIYENATLAEVVADANRYSATPIVIVDPAIGQLRVTTAYRTDQIDQMLSIVGASMPVAVVRGHGEVRLAPKS